MKRNFEKLGGLVPAVIQDASTYAVLMVGFMNEEALKVTEATGFVTFFSRTKNRLWKKGEESGNTLRVCEILDDCDNDTVLIKAIPTGPVCHTGATTCFGENSTSDSGLSFLLELQNIIKDRHTNPTEKSYTASLFQEGLYRIAQKVGEEAVETVLAATKAEGDEEFLNESADLLFHLMVLLEQKGIGLEAISTKLRNRHASA